MRIEEISSLGGLEGIRGEWCALIDRCTATPFQAPEWLIPWWRHLGGGELLVLAARNNGRLVGLAPFFIWGTPPQPRQVSLVGAGITDYLDFLLDPCCAEETAASLLDYLAAASRGRWAICTLDDVPAASTLSSAHAANLDRRVEPGSYCPVLRLPATWDELFSGLPARFRRSLRKARRALDGSKQFRIDTVDRAGLAACRDALFDLHRKRWRNRGEPGVLDDERVRRFHAESMTAMFENGRLRLYALWCDETIQAVIYCLAHHRRTYAYLAGFNPELEHCSPGAVALAHAIERAIGEGMTEFDFLRGREAYKYNWGGRDQATIRITLRPTEHYLS